MYFISKISDSALKMKQVTNVSIGSYCTDTFAVLEIDSIQNFIEVYLYIDIYCDIASTTSQEMIIWTRTKR